MISPKGMNKSELIREVYKLRKDEKKLKENNNFLLEQQKELTKKLSEVGSNVAKWKHKSIRLEEQNNLLLSKLGVVEETK